VHNHAVPREAIELLRTGGGYPIEVDGNVMEADRVRAELTPVFTEPEAKLEQLVAAGLDAAVVSGSPALFAYEVDGDRGAALCRAVNSGLASFCTYEPDRLRWLAHVPLQAPEAAAGLLAEATETGAVGAQIGTSVAGTPLSEADLDPFWTAAEEHDLPLMIHPAYNNPHPGLEGYHLQNAIGNQLETTIAAERLIVTGVLDRHPRLRLLLVHAGGYIPWQAGRLRHAASVRPELERDAVPYFDRLYLDTITHDTAALRFLVDRVGADNVAMGTDLPFDMATPQPVAALEEAVDAETARRVLEETPRRLFRLPSSTGRGAQDPRRRT
jgi:aminocarboxymuconate-semialdehyde decarboxylase